MPSFESASNGVVVTDTVIPTKGCTSLTLVCLGASDIAVTECDTESGTYTAVPDELLKVNLDSSGNGLVGYMGYCEYIQVTSSGTVIPVKWGILHAPSTDNTE